MNQELIKLLMDWVQAYVDKEIADSLERCTYELYDELFARRALEAALKELAP